MARLKRRSGFNVQFKGLRGWVTIATFVAMDDAVEFVQPRSSSHYRVTVGRGQWILARGAQGEVPASSGEQHLRAAGRLRIGIETGRVAAAYGHGSARDGAGV